MKGIRLLLPSLLLCATPGLATSQDTVRTYQQACDAGDLIACNVFGLMYETGNRVPRDPARAATLYLRACEGGELLGCTNLALLYESGTGVAQDVPRALGLYRVACEGGEMLGCGRLRSLEGAGGATLDELYFKTARVADVATREPLSNAIVEILDIGVRVSSDDAGRLALPPFPAGRYRLRAERLGYLELEGEFDVPGDAELQVFMTRASVDDPNAPGRIEGRVSGDQGEWLANVEVSAVGEDQTRTLTNGQGRFTLGDVEPGLRQIRFAILGYAPRTVTMIVQPGSRTEMTATMAVQPIELEPIRVAVQSTRLVRNGFYRRARFGWGGRQFERADIEAADPGVLSDLIRRAPGVGIRFGPQGTIAVGRQSCPLTVFVDGVQSFQADLDLIPPSQIEALEVYAGGISPPIEFSFGTNGCGVVLIWTRM